jgi:hypothetical protein
MEKDRKKTLLLISLFSAFFIVSFALSSSQDTIDSTSNSDENANTQVEPPVDNSWIPSNFGTFSGDNNVAYRWLENDEFDCGYGDSCWGIMIMSKQGCPNGLYAELSILDRDDVQVGYTNDSVGSALPLQKTKMIFETFEDSAHSARVSDISCY